MSVQAGQLIGWVVMAKRPSRTEPGKFEYSTAGSVWRDLEPVENHLAYCQMSAKQDPGKYGDVEYFIGEIEAIAS